MKITTIDYGPWVQEKYTCLKHRFHEVPVKKKGRLNWLFCFMQLPDGKIIFSSEGGTFIYNGNYFEPYSLYGFPPETIFRSIIKLPDGLLVNTLSEIYEKGNGKPWKLLFKNQDKNNDVNYVWYYAGKKYFADWYGAVYELSGSQPVLVFKPPETKKGTNVFFVDSRHNFWVAAFDKYLYKVNPDGEVSNFFSDQKMRQYSIWGIAEDKWGNIWLSTYQGLLKVSPSCVDSIEGLKLSYPFRNMYKGKSCLYFFGGEKGVYRFENGKEKKYPLDIEQAVSKQYKGIYITSAAEDNEGILWICNNAGNVFLLNDHEFRHLSIPFEIYFVSVASDELFLASDRHIYKWVNNHLTDISNNRDSFNGINNIVSVSNHQLWIGDNEKLVKFSEGRFINVSGHSKLLLQKFLPLNIHDEIWTIASKEGIIRIKYNTNVQLNYSLLNKSNGLGNDFILSFCLDKNFFLWYTTPTGIYRSKINFHNDSVYATLTRKFGKEDGIENTIWDSGPLTTDEQGSVWLAAINGIYKIDAQNISEDTIAPTVQIEKVELIRRTDWKHYTKTFSSYHNLPMNPRLPYRQNSISFAFNGVTMDHAEGVRFKYKLDGYDEQWSDLTSNKIATYTNLPAGTYRFAVSAMNSDGAWSNTPDSFEFVINPPFWETWWFRGTAGAIIILVLYYIIRRRELVKMRKNQLQSQIAELKLQALQSQMNPHFIFNSLNSVQNYILEHKPEEGARYLSKFSKLIRTILDNSRYNLLPLHQIVETLKLYIELESLRFNKEFCYELITDDEDEIMNRKLPPMLLQPFVENAIWHGLMPKQGDKKLKVLIGKKKILNDARNKNSEQDEILYCLIEDNGVGRKLTPIVDGHISQGEKMIQGMIETLQQLLNVKAEIMITDLNGLDEKTGTRIEIFIPYSSKM